MAALESPDALAGGDELEQPILIATSDLPETRRDVEHLLYANAFVSDYKIGMNNYVIEQAGAGQVIRVRGDSQQVLNVASQIHGLQGASEQRRMQQRKIGRPATCAAAAVRRWRAMRWSVRPRT